MANENDHGEQLNAILRELGEEVGVPDLSASEEGVCTLSVDDRWLLNLVVNPHTDSLIAWMLLGDVPGEERERFLTNLLRANLFWQKTRGGTLSLLPETDTVVISRSSPLGSDNVVRVKQLLEDLIEFADEYQRWLTTEEDDGDSETLVDDDAIRV